MRYGLVTRQAGERERDKKEKEAGDFCAAVSFAFVVKAYRLSLNKIGFQP
jgi:hypothetical protein